MRKRSIFRGIMIFAGLLAVCAILLSPSISTTKSSSAAKTEQSAEQPEGTVISAPTEAIPGSAVKLDEPSAPLIDFLTEPKEERSEPLIHPDQVVRYLKVLFRTVIASNAP